MKQENTARKVAIRRALAIIVEIDPAQPTWVAASDATWSAAHGRHLERRAWRLRNTISRDAAWLVQDVEDSIWAGEGHRETWTIQRDEPGYSIGGWAGGDGRTYTGGTVLIWPLDVDALAPIAMILAEVSTVESHDDLLQRLASIEHDLPIDEYYILTEWYDGSNAWDAPRKITERDANKIAAWRRDKADRHVRDVSVWMATGRDANGDVMVTHLITGIRRTVIAG